jgi:hypothetical protein
MNGDSKYMGKKSMLKRVRGKKDGIGGIGFPNLASLPLLLVKSFVSHEIQRNGFCSVCFFQYTLQLFATG